MAPCATNHWLGTCAVTTLPSHRILCLLVISMHALVLICVPRWLHYRTCCTGC